MIISALVLQKYSPYRGRYRLFTVLTWPKEQISPCCPLKTLGKKSNRIISSFQSLFHTYEMILSQQFRVLTPAFANAVYVQYWPIKSKVNHLMLCNASYFRNTGKVSQWNFLCASHMNQVHCLIVYYHFYYAREPSLAPALDFYNSLHKQQRISMLNIAWEDDKCNLPVRSVPSGKMRSCSGSRMSQK